MDIPWEKLSEPTLKGVIRDFVLREGTDYGPHEYSLEEKTNHVQKQLASGKAKIVFDAALGTCNILPIPT